MKIFIGRPVIFIDDEVYEVYTFNKIVKLKDKCAYVIDDYVYIYHGDCEMVNEDIPGIYLVDNNIYFNKPNKENRSKYTIDKIVDTEEVSDRIFNLIESGKVAMATVEDIDIVNNNANVFTPVIHPDDDFLKIIIKKVILDKKINLKNYAHKFKDDSMMTNMKSSLGKSTKMTVSYFKIWCEVLGINWDMTISDNGTDKDAPLMNEIQVNIDNYNVIEDVINNDINEDEE
jgi:hypothetical protein